jgi:hypothetical protein
VPLAHPLLQPLIAPAIDHALGRDAGESCVRVPAESLRWLADQQLIAPRDPQDLPADVAAAQDDVDVLEQE